MIGLSTDVVIEFGEPVFDRGAWRVSFSLTGSEQTFEDHTFGESPLQALALAIQLIRRLYEPELLPESERLQSAR